MHQTLDSWVAAFEEWSGMKTGERQQRGGNSWEVSVATPTGKVMAKLTVSEIKGDGWKFGGTSSVFPEEWNTLCRM